MKKTPSKKRNISSCGTFSRKLSIADHRVYNEALRQSEEKFRNLIETTSDWVWEVDGKGRYTYVSPKVKDILGYSPEEVIGKTPFDLMPAAEAEHIRKIFRSIVRTRKPFHLLANENLHKDGHPVVLQTSGMPFFDRHGKLCGYRGIDRDITVQKKTEEDLRKHRVHLQELVEERTAKLKDTNEKLRQEIRERKILEKLLISIEDRERRRVGHDLHDGLGQLLTGLAFKVRGLGRKIEQSCSGEAESAAEISVLVDEAKEMVSRISKGLHPVDTDREGLMRALEELCFSTRKMFGISCILICKKPVYLRNKPAITQLYRIAQEAVTNAMKHGHAEDIQIMLSKRYRKVALTVKDNGKGIPNVIKRGKGMGLRIMHYRASLISALLNIERKGRSGTVVSCTFYDS